MNLPISVNQEELLDILLNVATVRPDQYLSGVHQAYAVRM